MFHYRRVNENKTYRRRSSYRQWATNTTTRAEKDSVMAVMATVAVMGCPPAFPLSIDPPFSGGKQLSSAGLGIEARPRPTG